MKIVIIGTTAYQDKMLAHKKELEKRNHTVILPAFDDHPELNELEICEFNRKKIKEADEVHIFWDKRSMGTIFDFGMAFALRKKIKIVYLELKTFDGVMKRYERDNHV